jgi:hypothetical protein
MLDPNSEWLSLQGPVGRFVAPTMDAIRDALRYAIDL